MISPFVEEDAWCYWVVSVGALLSFLGLIVACICSCRRNENKNEFLGLSGMVTLNNSENEGFDRIPTTDVSLAVTQDASDCGKRTTGANRSLPDIPKDKEKGRKGTTKPISQDIYETTEAIGDHSELYATVQDTGAEEQVSEQQVQEGAQQKSLTRENSVSQYSRFASSNSDNGEHPYAQLQNVQKTETSQLNRNNIKQGIDTEKPSTSTSQASGNPVAPPRTRRSSSHNSLLSVDAVPCDIQAANAISGGIQANQDLPYMTPPLLMLLPQPSQPLQPTAQSNSPQQHFSGDSQDSKGYTSISVREPLANIIAQTKTICRQNQPIRPLTDPHYATVSDDSDEMYAAIDEQDKVYTSGSETYAQIQPTIAEGQRAVQTEQTLASRAPSRSDEVHPAPQPPSVDSLRYVAHAHSRQASSSSANSSIINPASPKPEKRQANSPLPPPPEGSADIYASIDKRTKTDERSKTALSSGKSLEDMYAKVMKKKKDVEEQTEAHPSSHAGLHPEIVIASCRKLSLVEINRTSWSSHDSTEVQKKEIDSAAQYSTTSNSSVGTVQPEAEVPTLPRIEDEPQESTSVAGHGYEAVSSGCDLSKKNAICRVPCDPNYEVLRPQRSAGDKVDYRASTNLGSGSASVSDSVSRRNSTDFVSFKQQRQTSNASSEDPGYEKVRLRRRIDTDQDTDSEPNYESMPHDSGEPNYASVCRPGDSDTDPNYESVNHGDPNYESVKYMSVNRTEEPPYEQVNAYQSQIDGYEKVKKHLFNSDYEKVQLENFTESIGNGDTDDEQYVQV